MPTPRKTSNRLYYLVMGLYKNARYSDKVRSSLEKDVHLSHLLDERCEVEFLTIGEKIRDCLVRPREINALTGLGYDGDVKGIDDVEPS